MRKKILYSLTITLMALLLVSFKSEGSDPRVISPKTAALVVVSRPAMESPVASVKKTDIIRYELLDAEENKGAYLDSDISDNSNEMEENTAGAQTQTEITEENMAEVQTQTEITEKNMAEVQTQTEITYDSAAEVFEQPEEIASINKDDLIEIKQAAIEHEPRSVYTIQTGSFTYIHYARDRFNSIAEELNDQELDHLRIEKVGEFNTVRLGKFEDLQSAGEFLSSIKSRLAEAIILNAYIKDQRIIQQINK
jgi:hypothetical protein